MSHDSDSPFQGQLSDERTARLWAEIARRLDSAQKPNHMRTRKGGLPQLAALGFALLIGGAAILWAYFPSKSAPLALLTTTTDNLSLTLEEGSKLAVDPHSQVRVLSSSDEQIGLELERGAIRCDVVHKEQRRFTVLAGDFEVRVVGTRFSVERNVTSEGSRVMVRVLRGAVEVRRVGQEERVFRVKAGQSWSSQERLLVEGAAPVEGAPGSSDPAGQAAPSPSPSPSDVAPELDGLGAKSPLGSLARPSLNPKRAPDVFEEASAARRAGRSAEAIQLYERFLNEARQDERRGLAAFEIARLEMDALSDPKRALPSLERAQRLSGGRFREDILARLAKVHSALGQTAACQKARSTYLKHYAKGVHRVEVEGLCP